MEQLRQKVADKQRRIQDIDDQIKQLKSQITELEVQKDRNIQNSNPETAVGLARNIREKHEELEILQQVYDNLKRSSAFEYYEAKDAWDRTCEIIRPKMEVAAERIASSYHEYHDCVEEIMALYKEACRVRGDIKGLAEREGYENYHLNKAITSNIDFHPYVLSREKGNMLRSMSAGDWSEI